MAFSFLVFQDIVQYTLWDFRKLHRLYINPLEFFHQLNPGLDYLHAYI